MCFGVWNVNWFLFLPVGKIEADFEKATYFHKNILFSGDSKDQKQKLDQLQKCLKDLITEENKAIKSSHAMARIQGLLNDSLLEGRGLENLEEMFEKALKEQKEPKLNVEKHEMMSKFESR